MALPVRYYKIRDRTTGLFLKTGYKITWNRKGRVWSTVAFLRASMKKYKGPLNPIPENWDIVEFVMEELSIKPVRQEFIEFYARRREERN